MSNSSDSQVIRQQMPDAPKGHVIGFVDSKAQCDNIIATLGASHVDPARIHVLHGEAGRKAFDEMMEGFQWGEEAERILKEGELELEAGHFVLCIEAKERGEGLRIAVIAQQHGGHGFGHFGTVVDERITR